MERAERKASDMTAAPMFRHHLYGLSIDSVFALPGAPVAARKDDHADLTITWSLPDTERDPPLTVTLPAECSGAPAFGIAQDGSHALIWDGAIAMLVSPDTRSLHVICRVEKLEFVPTVIVGIALGFVLHLRNVLCLHATVLGHAGRTIAVMGDSGSGKSSVAAAMVRGGAQFYSDDLAAVTHADDGSYRVQHGCMGLRIYADSATALLDGDYPFDRVPYLEKSLWDLSGQTLEPSPPRLDALYWLEVAAPGEGLDVSPQRPPREALPRIIRAWYPPNCPRLMNRERLDQMRQLALTVPLHVIRYEKCWANLPPLLELLSR
jgi:hypothetical protein